MTSIHIWPEAPKLEEGMVTVGVTLERTMRGNASGKGRKFWYYRVAEQHQHLFTDSADPFVVGVMQTAMHQGADIVVHGAVSPSLLTNLQEFQTAWVSWDPQLYKPMAIQAEQVWTAPVPNPDRAAISAFSGGVDSCFTVFRYHKTPPEEWPYQLTAGLMVHGFDIPLRDRAIFPAAAARSRRILASLGLDLIEMETNFREVIDFPWPHGFIGALASSLLLLQKGFIAGIIPSSCSYANMLNPIYTSNPITDRLLSNHRFAMIPDRLGSRVEKLAAIAGWPEALQDLRVCWQGAQKDRNCGKCEKCIRTILSCRVAGIGLPACFEQDVSDQQLRTLRLPSTGQVIAMAEVLNKAQAAGMDDSWLKVLNHCIWRNRGLNVVYEPSVLAIGNLYQFLKR